MRAMRRLLMLAMACVWLAASAAASAAPALPVFPIADSLTLPASGALALPAAGALAPAAARARGEPDDAPAQATDVLYLEVSVNDTPSGLVLRFTQGPRGLRSSADNLRQLGLDPALLGVRAGADIDLDGVDGLHYVFDAARQSLSLTVDDRLRAPFRVSPRSDTRSPAASASPGIVLNYDGTLQLGRQPAAVIANEVRYFDSRGAFTNSGLLTATRAGQHYLRYETSWSRADPDTLESFLVGDMITSSFSWTRAIRAGGLQWRKSFDLRPDLLTFPVAAVRGSALVPSALSLYVNGVQQYATTVPSGPFVVNQVAGINGAGEATVVTRDALGRIATTALPLYVDTRMLASGLSEYGLELGAPRRDFASRSVSYQWPPVVSASGRYGVSDAFTLEAHAETGRGLVNGGAGALVGLGLAGVVSLNLAASKASAATFANIDLAAISAAASASAAANAAGLPPSVPAAPPAPSSGGSGMQAGAGYQYVARRFSVDLLSTRASRWYADLATRDGSGAPRATDRAALNMALFGKQSLSLSLVGYKTAAAAPARIVSLAYGITLGSSVFVSVSGFQDRKQRSSRGLFASLAVALGNRTSVSASGGEQNGSRQHSVNILRTPDFDGGIGWGLQSGAIGQTTYRQAQVQYLGRYGQFGLLDQSTGSSRSTALEASGALVFMDNSVAAARQVGAAFALVSTTGVAGVPVLHENRVVGVTDASGHLLIPNLNAYGNNLVGIDVANLPIDARVDTVSMNAVPKRLSGLLARFPVERYSAATVILHDAAGVALAPGTRVRLVATGADTVIGYDGMAFVDGLSADNELAVGEGAGACTVHFAYVRPASGLPNIGPLTCASAPGVH